MQILPEVPMKFLRLFIIRWRMNHWFGRMNRAYQMGMQVDTMGGLLYWQERHRVATDNLNKVQSEWKALI
jgi:hypothetical protein